MGVAGSRTISAMRTVLVLLSLCLLGCGTAAAQGDPKPTELPGKPFVIKQTWTIGGEGDWDYLTLDPVALQLFVAHGTVVQVVDLSTGAVAGEVTGLRDAHGIALDDSGAVGYISDGPSNQVKVFDRRSLQVVASIRTGPNPRAVVYDPASKLVFAICTQPLPENAGGGASGTSNPARRTNPPAQPPPAASKPGSGPRPGTDQGTKSVVTVIDAETRTALADVLLAGKLGFAQADGRGEVFVNVTDRNQIVHFDAQAIDGPLHKLAETAAPAPAATPAARNPAQQVEPPMIDWSGTPGAEPAIESPLHHFRLGADCKDPKGLAIDSAHLRIFAACDNMKMEVLNAENGDHVATLPTGAGTDAIGYDPDRGLIYIACGGGVGGLTIIRQTLNDTYAVIQELPTRNRARTLAVNPSSGEVYLVTNILGYDLSKPGVGGSAHTLPAVPASPVKGTFQVLVVGN